MPLVIPNLYNFDSDSNCEFGSDSESEFADFNYNNSKYSLVLCEIHNPQMHGFTANSDPNICGHYLMIGEFDFDSFICGDPDNLLSMEGTIDSFNENLTLLMRNSRYHYHPTIRNYKNIVLRENYIRPEIAECVTLSGNERVTILKTFWIRIIQRAWKRIFRERYNILIMRMNVRSLFIWQQTGKWPLHCRNLPGLRGMLENI